MNRPPVKQIQRVALAAGVAVTLVLAGSYGVRRWRAYQALRAVPKTMPADIQQQAKEFNFSRSEAGHTLFTVRASRTVERAGQLTVLEEVVIRIFGRRGERADEIRTGRCEYDVGRTGTIRCPGAVAVRLGAGSPADASAATAPAIQLNTAGVEFDPAEAVAWTDQPVRFSFPTGSGEAVGLRYRAQEGTVLLEKQVSILVTRGAGVPIRIRGSQLRYHAGTQTFELFPPLELQVGDRVLVADRVEMVLDNNFRTQRVEAAGNVRARGEQDGRQLTMRAERAVAEYGSDGLIQQLRASERVEFEGRGGGSEEKLTCREALFTFEPSHRWIERLVATGGAQVVSRTAAETRELRAPVLEFGLRLPGRQQQLLTATQRATLTLRRVSGEQRTVVADRIQLQFEEQQRLRGLAASGSVETSETRPGTPGRTTTSEELRARFDTEGSLSEAEQWGHFHYRGGRWQAKAGRAEYRRATDTLLLREQPVVWDETTRTSARLIEVAETTATLRAEGEVRTTQRPSADTRSGFGSGEPVQLAADRMWADQEKGWARYEGQARLWQGQNRLQAAAIELFRLPEKLVAEGDVSGLFLETPAEPSGEKPAAHRRAVTITSERFTYVEAERRGIFEGRVAARNDFGTLTAPRLEVFLSPGEGGGSERLERAHAAGGVRIEQGARQASSEQAEYSAAAQTVVLWGGTPTIVDPERGSTSGARLTLFLANGSIAVDSGEGTRTVTRRPWTQ